MKNMKKDLKNLGIITLVGSLSMWGLAKVINDVPEHYYNSLLKNKINLMNLIDKDSSRSYSFDEMEYLTKVLESCNISYEINGDTLSFDHRNKQLKQIPSSTPSSINPKTES